MRSVVTDFLKGLGFPGDWKHANRAFRVIRDHGFMVSPAAELMVRQFGGLNTLDNQPPAIRALEGVVHGPSRFEVNPFEACLSKDELAEMEAFHKAENLCPVGVDYTGVGVMCITPLGHVYFEGSPWGYAGTPTEVVIRLLSGTPNL
jgi:hypothetical protein